jgi:hypothetical protein
LVVDAGEATATAVADREDFSRLHACLVEAALVGPGTSFAAAQQGEAIRTDHVVWLKADPAASASEGLLHDRAEIRAVVERLCHLPDGLSADGPNPHRPVQFTAPSHVQLSHYGFSEEGGGSQQQGQRHSPATGARYVAHRDNKPPKRLNVDDDAAWLSDPEQRFRCLTCILYVTPPDWNASKDGGALRVFLDTDDEDDTGQTASATVELEPKLGRLVLFQSNRVLHEVLPTCRNGRFAFTIWLLQKPRR